MHQRYQTPGGLLLIGMSLLLGASLAVAAPIDVTIQDYNTALWGFNGAGSTTSGGYSNRGNFGLAKEDNETEAGTIAGQLWDMEAFVVNGTQLSIVAGFDLLNGVQAHNISAGDLFIKVGGPQPGFAPTNQGAGNVFNSNYGSPGYTYAIDLSKATRFGNASFGPTAQVYTLSQTSVLNTVVYDQFDSNPWKYSNTLNTAPGSATNITYLTGQADNSAALQALGLGWLSGGNHNILTIDLGFLTGTVAAGTQVHFSYTMECGNDSLKGKYSGGFNVPDQATTALMMALGLATLGVYGLKRQQVR